jgi:TolA-binding protein
VLFRYAENNYFRGEEARNNANLPNRVQALAQLDEETIKRYQKILADYPDHPQVNLARHAIALGHYHRGEIDKARAMFENIPSADRVGELAVVPYLHADCLLRLAPTAIPEDALEAGLLEDQLKSAATLLEGFIASQPKAAEVGDALLKLGVCQQRRAELLVEPTARQQMLTQARTAYEQLMQPAFAQHPAAPQAVFERARCLAAMGDQGGAVNEMRRFTTNPLQNAFIAPMARLHLALLLRRQNQAAEAVNVLAAARQQYEPTLRADKARDTWVSLIRLHHGLALEEANKLADARGVYDSILKEYAASPEAPEAALHFGQCLLDEGRQQRDAADKARREAKTPEQQTAADKLAQQALATITQGVQFLEAQATQLAQKDAKHPTRAQMIYQTAWGYRDLAEPEVATVRARLTEELAKKLNLDQHKLVPPAVPLEQVPLQPSEQKTRAQYQALIQAFPDLPLAATAAFELAELFAQRKEFDQAVQYLVASLDREPPEELTEQLRIRLGDVFLRQGKHAEALAQFEAVLANPMTKQAAQAHYRAGETLMDQKKWADAEKHLAVFRDQGPFQNVPGVSDKALLRLGQAYANLNDWNRSRQAYETLVSRFGGSPWVDEAHYGIGWSWQQLKQYDQAAAAYAQVTARTASETAARAQLQIGRCRFAQGRHAEASTALLVVPFTYDFPDLSAVALLEAAVALEAMKETGQAVRLLERVVRDHPDTKWAQAATERLKTVRQSP